MDEGLSAGRGERRSKQVDNRGGDWIEDQVAGRDAGGSRIWQSEAVEAVSEAMKEVEEEAGKENPDYVEDSVYVLA